MILIANARYFEPCGIGSFFSLRPEWPTGSDPMRSLHVIEHIDADTLAIRIAAWKTVVVDVRDAHAFQAARIPEAILVPLEELVTALRGLPLETCLSLVCETGKQSDAAAVMLSDCGYRNIAVLTGGFANYVQRGLPVATP